MSKLDMDKPDIVVRDTGELVALPDSQSASSTVAPETHEVFARREDGPNFRGVSWSVTIFF
jgi:hypothetical protein